MHCLDLARSVSQRRKRNMLLSDSSSTANEMESLFKRQEIKVGKFLVVISRYEQSLFLEDIFRHVPHAVRYECLFI